MRGFLPLKADDKACSLSFEQKLWKGTRVLVGAVKPALLYLFLPPLLMSVGMALFGGRSAEKVITDSGNFYYALGILLTIVLLARKSRKNGSSLCREAGLEWKLPEGKRVVLLMVVGLGFAVFFSAVLTLVPFPEALKNSYSSSSDILKNGTDLGLAMLCTVLMAPVAEEIVFRGYMLGRLLSWFSKEQAIALSAVLFALCHVSPLWIAYACFMGILLAWVSIREDDTMYSIALHIGFNVSVVPISLINGNSVWKEPVPGSSLGIAFIGAAALLSALAAFKGYRHLADPAGMAKQLMRIPFTGRK